jgi:cysteine desulfurase / selenocysteine lyase
MGYSELETQKLAGSELWSRYRDEFPVTERLIYLNHAAVTPLPRRAAQAMKDLAEDGCLHGSLHYSQWMQCYDDLRAHTARLINANKGEIALVKNTSEGIATVALGFPWKAGDRVVAFREEFPANLFIWKKLEEWKGIRVEWLSYLDPIEEIARAARGARFLAISFVQYLSGFRADLKAIGEICRREGVFFFVDAIQGMGAFPLDVRAMNIQALAADGHKWMLGPEGCGVLYVQQDWQDRIEPVEFGWTNVAAYADYSSRAMDLRADAGRYECGTLNTIGCFGLRAALELVLEVGVEQIAPAVQGLADRLAAGAKAKGYQTLGERTPATGAGIVCVRREGLDSRQVHALLRDKGIATAPRQGWVRMSPHFYISPEEIDRVVVELP